MASEACCNQEDACALQQRLDDEPEPVRAEGQAEGQAPILKPPSVAAFDWPAPLAQSRSVWLPTHGDLGLGSEGAAQIAMLLSVITLVRETLGREHGPEAGHDRKGSQEQALEDPRVIDGGGRRHTRDRSPIPIPATWYVVPRLARSVGLGPVRSPPRLARTEQLARIRSGWPRSMLTSTASTCGSRPIRAQRSKQRRKVDPLALVAVAIRLRQRVPSRRNCRRVAATRTVAVRG